VVTVLVAVTVAAFSLAVLSAREGVHPPACTLLRCVALTAAGYALTCSCSLSGPRVLLQLPAALVGLAAALGFLGELPLGRGPFAAPACEWLKFLLALGVLGTHRGYEGIDVDEPARRRGP
jgi:hypothetical protein